VIDLTEWLLTSLLNHGASLLGVALFLAAFGIPLPATLLLLAAGAFVGQGILPIGSVLLAAIGGAIAGDACSYLVGRYSMRWVPARIRDAVAWQRAAALFERWGGWAVFVTRFLLTPVALPMNLLAGSTRYAPSRFMGAVIVGEVLWVVLYGGLGHAFSSEWEALGRIAGDLVGLLLGLVLLGIGAYLLLRRRHRKSSRGLPLTW